MAQAFFLGINDKAKYARSLFYGVDGKAKKLKAVFYGVLNKAKQVFKSGNVVWNHYSSTSTNTLTRVNALSNGGSQGGVVSIGNRILVGAYVMHGSTTVRNTVDCYDKSLVKSMAPDLSVARGRCRAVSNGEYALFGGGDNNGYNANKANVDYYTSSLTRGTATNMTNAAHSYACGRVGDYMIFCGGAVHDSAVRTVDAYNLALTKSNPTAITNNSIYWPAVTIGTNFGFLMPYSNSFDYYNFSLTKTTQTSINTLSSSDLYSAASLRKSNKGVLLNNNKQIILFDDILTQTVISNSELQTMASLTSIEDSDDIVIWSHNSDRIIHYNESMSLSIIGSESLTWNTPMSGSLGKYAMFFGGRNGDTANYVTIYKRN